MPESIQYVQCCYCADYKRKDNILRHLTTHAELAIQYLPLVKREQILTKRKPFISLFRKDNTLHFTVCLHCKKGSLSCSERNRATSVFLEPHTECMANFEHYEKIFQLKDDSKPNNITKWVEISPAKYRELKGKPLIVQSQTPKPTKESTKEPIMPKALSDALKTLWTQDNDARIAEDKAVAEAEGDSYETDDEQEPDLMDKLAYLINEYKYKRRYLKDAYATIKTQRDEISVLRDTIELKNEQIENLIKEKEDTRGE